MPGDETGSRYSFVTSESKITITENNYSFLLIQRDENKKESVKELLSSKLEKTEVVKTNSLGFDIGIIGMIGSCIALIIIVCYVIIKKWISKNRYS